MSVQYLSLPVFASSKLKFDRSRKQEEGRTHTQQALSGGVFYTYEVN
ncbi:hypothetical protein [Tychonema sp. LEGE 07203]|nr:hypothetical protein [Tychonema sp. LEGE 07203]